MAIRKSLSILTMSVTLSLGWVAFAQQNPANGTPPPSGPSTTGSGTSGAGMSSAGTSSAGSSTGSASPSSGTAGKLAVISCTQRAAQGTSKPGTATGTAGSATSTGTAAGSTSTGATSTGSTRGAGAATTGSTGTGAAATGWRSGQRRLDRNWQRRHRHQHWYSGHRFDWHGRLGHSGFRYGRFSYGWQWHGGPWQHRHGWIWRQRLRYSGERPVYFGAFRFRDHLGWQQRHRQEVARLAQRRGSLLPRQGGCQQPVRVAVLAAGTPEGQQQRRQAGCPDDYPRSSSGGAK